MPAEPEIRVVYVEDDERLARLTTQYLNSHRVEVHVVSRGDQVMPAVLRVRPDVVLLDLMLPGSDGRDVCRELRAPTDVPIIMVTARTEEAAPDLHRVLPGRAQPIARDRRRRPRPHARPPHRRGAWRHDRRDQHAERRHHGAGRDPVG